MRVSCIRCKSEIHETARGKGFVHLAECTPQPANLLRALERVLTPRFSFPSFGRDVIDDLCTNCALGIVGMHYGMLPGFVDWVIKDRDSVLMAVFLLAGDINPQIYPDPDFLAFSTDQGHTHTTFEQARKNQALRKTPLVRQVSASDSSRHHPRWAALAFTLWEAMRAVSKDHILENSPILTLHDITRAELAQWWNGNSPRVLRNFFGYFTPPLNGNERLPQENMIPETEGRKWGSFQLHMPAPPVAPAPPQMIPIQTQMPPPTQQKISPMQPHSDPAGIGTLRKFGAGYICIRCGARLNVQGPCPRCPA